MRPRRFYIFFPPALVKWTRNGIEYGIGAIPLGGYVKIPGMHRPAAGDLDAHLEPARDEAPWLARRRQPVEQALAERALRGRARRHRRAARATVGDADLSERAPAAAPSRASPTSTTRSRPTPTGARRPGSASRSSSPGRRRTSSSPSSRWRSSSCSASRPAPPATRGRGHGRLAGGGDGPRAGRRDRRRQRRPGASPTDLAEAIRGSDGEAGHASPSSATAIAAAARGHAEARSEDEASTASASPSGSTTRATGRWRRSGARSTRPGR